MKRGFSLLESVFLVGITAVALLALVNLFVIFSSLNGYQQAMLAVHGSASSAMSSFQSSVLPAKKILASRTFSGTTYSSTATSLVLELPAVDSAGAVIAGVSDYIVFYSAAGTLYRLTEVGAGSARAPGLKILSSTLRLLSFTYTGNDLSKVSSVTVDLETEASYKQQTVRVRVREQLYLRNFSPL